MVLCSVNRGHFWGGAIFQFPIDTDGGERVWTKNLRILGLVEDSELALL